MLALYIVVTTLYFAVSLVGFVLTMALKDDGYFTAHLVASSLLMFIMLNTLGGN